MNRSTLIVSLLIIAGTLILMGGSYAYFTAMATSDEQTVQSGTLELTYQTGKDILLENAIPTEETEAGIHQFTVENTGTLEAVYYLYLDNIILQKDGKDTQSENLKWKLYRATEDYTQQEEIASGNFIDGNNTIELDTKIAIQPGEKHYYILKLWLQETGKLQNEDQGLEFSTIVEATTVKKKINKTLVSVIKEEAVLDNIASTYVTSPTGIDFSQVSSDTNGKGLYILHGTETTKNPIMYYRGAVENNNVKFANFCWLIVRTTETGGVKLIYNGEPDENGTCHSSSKEIAGNDFNSGIYTNAGVGYMYGSDSADNYEETHANINNSMIKTVIDSWYEENMLDYTENLEDTVWCNDRSISSNSSGDGIDDKTTEYGAYYRLYNNKTPSLECVNPNDQFTVNNENGNGALTYPVALLTADEVAYAGEVYRQASNTYLSSEEDGIYWTLSPSIYNKGIAFHFTYELDGLQSTTYGQLGVRPAISLKNRVKVKADGDGTAENPYVVV